MILLQIFPRHRWCEISSQECIPLRDTANMLVSVRVTLLTQTILLLEDVDWQCIKFVSGLKLFVSN